MGNVKFKVSGDKKDVEQCLVQLQVTFALMLVSKLFANDSDSGVHCFIDLDPYAIRKVSPVQNIEVKEQ